MAEQNFKNHARLDPKVHLFLMPLATACFIAALIHARHQQTPANMLLIFVTLTVLAGVMIMRIYSLQVQNRVIRLEEQTRLHRLGVDAASLTMQQFIALRFAPDNEVGALTARARTEALTSKQIKAAIVTWRPDNDRV